MLNMLLLSRPSSLVSFAHQHQDQAVKCTCTHCGEVLKQDKNLDGLNFCTNCRKLFLVAPEPRVPPMILAVLAALIANWQILRHLCQ